MSLGVQRLLVDPQASANLYAASDHGSYISNDGGTTWVGTPWVGTGFVIRRDLVIDPSTPSTLYAVGLSALSRSTDAGAHWTPITTLPSTSFDVLAVDPQNSNTLYLGGDGISKSTDGGATWKSVGPTWRGQLFNPAIIRTLAVDPASPATVYAGTDGSGIVKSTDGGVTWAPSNHGVPGFGYSIVDVIAIDPVTSSTLYATVASRGVIKSTDAGASWIPTNAGLPGAFFSQFGSMTSFAIDPSNPARVYAGTSQSGPGKGIIRSTDGGASWNAFNTGLLDTRYPVVSLDPNNPSTLYAGTLGLSVFRRTATCAGDADCDDSNDCTIDTCDSGTDTCTHVAAADGAPCSDGFTCRTSGTCSSGICVNQGVTTAGACQNTLVPGGTARGRQCTQEWFLLALPSAGGGALTNHRLTCADDDPLCDFGPPGDHACTFRLALCFNMTQPPTACTPTDVARVQVLRPNQRTTDPVQIANRKALSDALVGLGGDLRGLCTNTTSVQLCIQNSDCDTQPGSGDGHCNVLGVFFSPALSARNVCTTLTEVKVPLLPRASGGFKPGTQRIRVSTSPSTALPVLRSFGLSCRPHQ